MLSGANLQTQQATDTPNWPLYLKWAAGARLFCQHKGIRTPSNFLDMEWWAIEMIKRSSERPVLTVYQRLLREQQRHVVRELPKVLVGVRLSADLPYSTTKTTAEIVASIFDLARWNRLLEERLPGPLFQLLRAGWANGFARIGASDPGFTASSHLFEPTLRAFLDKGKAVNATTADQLIRTITDKLSAGDELDDIIRAASQVFDVAYEGRAVTAARTMTAGSFEAGQQGSFVEAGIESKMWLSVRDGNVRDATFDHITPDGQVVLVTEPFSVSGEELMFPVDPSGSAGNVINCRCTSLPITRQ